MSDSLFEKGVTCHRSGDTETAISFYNQAIEENDQSDTASYNLALLFAQSGRGEEAKTSLHSMIVMILVCLVCQKFCCYFARLSFPPITDPVLL